MDLYSIILIAIGLAMDVFSVAAVTGFVLKRVSLNQIWKMPLSFGSFHAIMPIIGWFMGLTIVNLVANFDHWVAFLLLAFVGGRMIYGARKEKETNAYEMVGGLNLLFCSVAVSIDALAVGLSFFLENVTFLFPVVIIGFTASVFTLIGLVVGSRSGRHFGKSMEIIGGLILIGIGLRIVFTHIL